MSELGQVMAKLEDIRRATLIGVKETLTLAECAMLTGYSIPTLYAFTSKRKIPHYKRGNYLYFSKREVEQWLLNSRVPTMEEMDKEASAYVAARRAKI